VPDYVYGADLELLSTGSTIELTYDGSLVVDTFAYDDVDYDVQSGVSLALHPDQLTGDEADNDDDMFWCTSTTSYGSAGQSGTPGAQNEELVCSFFDVSYTSSPNLAIPDGDPTGVTDSQTVADVCTIISIDVDVDIPHGWIGDVILELIAPDGTVVRLHDEEGGSIDDLIGNYPNDPPHGYQAQPLDPFIGLDAQGDWTLFASDSYSIGSGYINSWTLNLTCG
ncbi:MAG: proprotein convertase P-domain-containing protein, partial [Myxococcota bacterium]